jgi:hypothetical protein
MTLELEIKLKCDGQEVHLARETAHLSVLSDTQRVMVHRVAKAAIEILAGEKILTQSLHEHLTHPHSD